MLGRTLLLMIEIVYGNGWGGAARRVRLGPRPGAHQGLVEVVFVVARGCLPSLDLALARAVDAAPAAHGLAPRRAHFREHAEPRAHVLGALGVVGGGGEHLVWPMADAVLRVRVKRAHAAAVISGLAADLLERPQSVEAIQRGVLDSLGGDRRGDLLELHCEGTYGAPELNGRPPELQPQRRTDGN